MHERDDQHCNRSETERRKRAARFALNSLEALLRIRKTNNQEVTAQDIVVAFNETRQHILSDCKGPQDFALGKALAVGKESELGYQEIKERGARGGWMPVSYDAHRHMLIHELNELIEEAITAPPQSSPPAER